MYSFSSEQKTYQVGNVRIGGQPGERATVLCGSIFYRGHKIVRDNLKGSFDKEAARALLDEEAAISDETGNPRIVDVIGDTGEALARHAEFVLAETDSPILFDSLTPVARAEALELLKPDAVAAERIIYNSLDPNSTEHELETIAKYGIRSAVLLAFDKLALLPQARLKLLTEPGGLLDKAKRAGIQHCLVDPGVLDVPSLAWTVITIGYVKEQLGLPGGCAPSNSVYLWKKMRAKGSPVFVDKAEQAGAAIIGASALLTTTMGEQKELVEYLKSKGLRSKYKVIIGGGPTTQGWADQIGADGWAETANEAVALCHKLLG